MPDRPDHDHRRSRFRTPVAVVALVVLAASAATAGAAVGAAANKRSRPTVSQFSFSPSTFAAGAARTATQGQRATTIKFRLSRRSTVSIEFARRSTGRLSKSGKRCLAPTAKLAKRRPCTRYVAVGRIVRANLKAGERSVAFSGRMRGRGLAAGRYRATIVASGRRDRKSRPKTATFTVVSSQQSNSGTPPATAPPSAVVQRRNVRPCTVTVPNVAAVQSTVASAAPGAVVCLAPGTYGKLSLSANPAGEVVVQPAGAATIAGASLAGSNLTLEGFNVVGDAVTVQPGSNHMTVQFNQISGGYYGVEAGPTTTTTVNDVTIRGNKFIGNFGEDAIRLNRYHDGPDADPYGALIEGNEITGVVEDGNHNDCLQTVWVGDHLYIQRNYLHDNNCQGFFIKDQASPIDTVVIQDNLIANHNLPCQPASLCPNWVLSPVQVFGPVVNHVFRNNTIWTNDKDGPTMWRGSGLQNVEIDHNVIWRAESDTTISGLSEHDDTVCKWTGLPSLSPTSTKTCSLSIPNKAVNDFRQSNGRGVTWAPADQHYGP
jgi:Right handed beta helix region